MAQFIKNIPDKPNEALRFQKIKFSYLSKDGGLMDYHTNHLELSLR
jgi:hypothetical protein